MVAARAGRGGATPTTSQNSTSTACRLTFERQSVTPTCGRSWSGTTQGWLGVPPAREPLSPLDSRAVLEDVDDVCERVDVLGRVAVHDEDVCPLAFLERADLIVYPA